MLRFDPGRNCVRWYRVLQKYLQILTKSLTLDFDFMAKSGNTLTGTLSDELNKPFQLTVKL